MAQSVQKNFNGPVWPLGLIVVPTPGTPVNIMSLVDASNLNDPSTASSTSGSGEYTVRAQQIIFEAQAANGTTGTKDNAGNVYIMVKGVQGLGNRTDYGSMVYVLEPGTNLFLGSAALNRNVWSPYEFYLDADNAADGALITLLIQ